LPKDYDLGGDGLASRL